MTNGKGDKWRMTDYYKYFLNFPDGMGPDEKKDKKTSLTKDQTSVVLEHDEHSESKVCPESQR